MDVNETGQIGLPFPDGAVPACPVPTTLPAKPVGNIEALLARLPDIRTAVAGMKDIVLANLVMIGEIPAPTGDEGARVQLILQRLSEAGLQNCSSDETGNGYGVLFGETGVRNLLITGHVDTFVSDVVDQTVELASDRIVGPFVGDNSLALAAMVSLPVLFDRLQIRLKSNIIFHAAAKAFGRGNLEGLRYFLTNSALPIHAGLCLEGVQLGRLNYACLGVLRGEIVCRLPDDYKWAQYGATGAIIPLNDVITRINKIALPRRPLTTMVLGSVEGGIAYYNIARQAILRFEVRGEDSGLLKQIRQQIKDIAAEVAAQSGVKVTFEVVAEREPGGIDIAHPLVQDGRAILGALGREPMLYPTTSALSAFVDRKIPAVTLGVALGERRGELDEIDEAVPIASLLTGVAQLAGMVMALDQRAAADG